MNFDVDEEPIDCPICGRDTSKQKYRYIYVSCENGLDLEFVCIDCARATVRFIKGKAAKKF
jgi:hypothetical protein